MKVYESLFLFFGTLGENILKNHHLFIQCPNYVDAKPPPKFDNNKHAQLKLLTIKVGMPQST